MSPKGLYHKEGVFSWENIGSRQKIKHSLNLPFILDPKNIIFFF